MTDQSMLTITFVLLVITALLLTLYVMRWRRGTTVVLRAASELDESYYVGKTIEVEGRQCTIVAFEGSTATVDWTTPPKDAVKLGDVKIQ